MAAGRSAASAGALRPRSSHGLCHFSGCCRAELEPVGFDHFKKPQHVESCAQKIHYFHVHSLKCYCVFPLIMNSSNQLSVI